MLPAFEITVPNNFRIKLFLKNAMVLAGKTAIQLDNE